MSEYSNPTKFIDLQKQQTKIREKINQRISNVLDHGNYIMGPEVKEFEELLKKFSGSRHAITCANGTDALTISMMALGLKSNDVVFIPSFTYVASAETVAQLGAIPFFVDVKKDTFNMDPDSLKQAIIDVKEIGLNPRIVMPVDLFGQPAEIDEIIDIAKNNNLKTVIDGAQSFGSEYKNLKACTYGDISTTSFFPAKPLGCYGDGGAIFTQDSDLAEIIDSIRLHGKGVEKYDNVRIGVNSRLDTLQAAILIEKLAIFQQEIKLRNEFAALYNLNMPEGISCPIIPSDFLSVWAQYTIISENRDELRNNLSKNNIPSVIYYPKPLSQQDGYKDFPRVSTGLRISESLPNNVLSLPMHPYLTADSVIHTCKVIKV